jgi:hypothetical protein
LPKIAEKGRNLVTVLDAKQAVSRTKQEVSGAKQVVAPSDKQPEEINNWTFVSEDVVRGLFAAFVRGESVVIPDVLSYY